MKRCVLLDTGPIVAFLNRKDEYHDWARNQWNQIAPPMFTCESVLSEAGFLLGTGSAALFQLLRRRVIAISFRLDEHLQPVEKLLRKYDSVPMSLADACLVRMSEIQPNGQVITLDSDFNLYRKNGRQTIPTIMPG